MYHMKCAAEDSISVWRRLWLGALALESTISFSKHLEDRRCMVPTMHHIISIYCGAA